MIPEALRRICQSALPAKPWAVPALARLPGMMPVGAGAWIVQDEAFAEQMALRDHLVNTVPDQIMAAQPGAEAVIAEALQAVLAVLQDRPGYRREAGAMIRPDGTRVPLDAPRGAPLAALARLVQEDICLLMPDSAKNSAEHVLVAATLAFPASWSLAEKLGRPLTGVHEPVAPYDANLAARVERLFAGLKPGRPLMRMNALAYEDPCLFQPRRENARRDKTAEKTYLRSERQCLVRLPQTGGVAFTIHSYVLPLAQMSAADRQIVRSFSGA